MRSMRSLATWVQLIGNGLHPRSAVSMRRGDYRDIRFRGHGLEGADRRRLAWMAMRIWGGEYDWPGFVPGRGERVADLGANVGVFAVLAAARGARVTAVEPHPTTFAALRLNTAPWDVECRQAAVVGQAPAAETVELVEAETDTAHHLASIRGSAAEAPSVAVPAVAFATILEEGYDLIKLDVEGAEFEILEQTPADALARVPRLVAELHLGAGDPENVRARLESAGLTVTLTAQPEDPAHLLLRAHHARSRRASASPARAGAATAGPRP